MFERFTDRARRVVVLAQEEARLLDHDAIRTEHLVLGLIHEGKGIGARALTACGVTLSEARRAAEAGTARSPITPQGPIPFTEAAKQALELSLREALSLGHEIIGTEHVLLGAVTERASAGAPIFAELAITPQQVRATVMELLDPSPGSAGEDPSRDACT